MTARSTREHTCRPYIHRYAGDVWYPGSILLQHMSAWAGCKSQHGYTQLCMSINATVLTFFGCRMRRFLSLFVPTAGICWLRTSNAYSFEVTTCKERLARCQHRPYDTVSSMLSACTLHVLQEDLCLMAEVEGELRFVSGVVCFPQRWTIGEKVGMNMERIHEPVPRFNQQLGRSVGGFMNRLAPRKPFWRINWAVSDNPDLFQPVAEDLIIQTNGGMPSQVAMPGLPCSRYKPRWDRANSCTLVELSP